MVVIMIATLNTLAANKRNEEGRQKYVHEQWGAVRLKPAREAAWKAPRAALAVRRAMERRPGRGWRTRRAASDSYGGMSASWGQCETDAGALVHAALQKGLYFRPTPRRLKALLAHTCHVLLHDILAGTCASNTGQHVRPPAIGSAMAHHCGRAGTIPSAAARLRWPSEKSSCLLVQRKGSEK